MALFQYLDDNIFMIFSGSNRRLYEEVLVRIYQRFFADSLSFPAQTEVIHEIYETLRDHPELWTEEESLRGLPDLLSKNRRRVRRVQRKTEGAPVADLALQRARHIYVRLNECGWLEEEQFGLRVTVDMPMGAMLLMEQLARLRAGFASRLGGVVIEIRNALSAVRLNASENAQGLRQARENAENFVRSLRAILSSLKQIQKDILASTSFEERLASIFEDFIERLLLRDFAAMTQASSHPYRFRGEILRTIQDIEHDRLTLEAIGRAYQEAGLVGTSEDGVLEAESDLLAITRIFEQIGEMYARINSFRRQLEARLRNTVRYAERGRRGFAERAEALILRLDRLVERDGARYERLLVDGLLEPVFTPWDESLQAKPRRPRDPVEPGVLRPRVKDPAFEAYVKLKRLHAERLNPPPERVLRFLERQVPPRGMTEARWLKIETVDDFIAFDIVRRALHTTDPTIAAHFALEQLPDAPPHDSEWMRCENFIIRRLDDHVTLETPTHAL